MNKKITPTAEIKAIIGLGNYGNKFHNTRHNIGFDVLDVLAQRYHAAWQERDQMEYAEISSNNNRIVLIKPLTYMNHSGKVIPFLLKKGIKPEEILVVHDELEKPFGFVGFRLGGSARGHNGLRSIISVCGDNFPRLRIGIDRPENKEDVADYVLAKFTESHQDIAACLDRAVAEIESLLNR